jgi:serine/threonine-protein kinase
MSNESDQPELYVRPFPGPGGKWQVSSGRVLGQRAAWSPNGRDLFYLNTDRQLMTVSYTASGDVFSAGKPRLFSSVRIVDFDIAPDGRSFAVTADAGPGSQSAPPLQLTFLVNFFDELRRRVPPGN